jgi:four helix bundle protein
MDMCSVNSYYEAAPRWPQITGLRVVRGRAEFIARIGVVAEEADESVLWIELLGDAGVTKKDLLAELLKEAKELTAIFTASRETAKRK